MFTWKRREQGGYNCYLGEWPVGGVFMDIVAKGNPKKWSGKVTLPGLNYAVAFVLPEEAKKHVENRVAWWFQQIPADNLKQLLEVKTS